MRKLFIVNNPKSWPLNIPGIEVVAARDYLMDAAYSNEKGVKIFNLCRSYRYQTTGYYVSLLAAARGHTAFPGITTIEDMRSQQLIRGFSDDIDDLIQKSLGTLQSGKFTLSIYFGRNVAKKYDQLSAKIFSQFQAPLIRSFFTRRGDKWRLSSIQLISANDIPDEHFLSVMLFAEEYFSRPIYRARIRKQLPYDMAILVNEKEEEPPSDTAAIRKFIKAAHHIGFNTEIISKDEGNRLAEFDALFIRETTGVNHYTFRMAQRARADGLVVIDDPDSILKCTNKVYLAELLNHFNIPAPRTVILNKDNISTAHEQLGFPVILKQPDSSFSQGVMKVDTLPDLMQQGTMLFDKSDLIIAQEFTPTDYDWRIGVMDNVPIFACKYYMARSHWQVMNWDKKGKARYGKWETVDPESAPPEAIDLALKISSVIGNGLYGVDIKHFNGRYYVIEINDNPNIDNGVEDRILGDELYLKIMRVFYDRVKRLKGGVH
ncbi:MAG TPA: RimK family protein [Spirochaetota bacterium]|nr:RimK family protein [Spirochaetota bacterium]